MIEFAERTAEACQRIAFGMPMDDFSCGAGWRWIDVATQGGAEACALEEVTGALVTGHEADFLVLDASGPEVRASWDFSWEMVRYFDRANLVASVVGGKAAIVGGRSARFDSESFIEDAVEEGSEWMREAPIVRLHGSSSLFRRHWSSGLKL